MGENAGTVVTSRDADSRAPVVSPDGTRIAYQSSRRSGWDVYVVSEDGSLETAILTLSGAHVALSSFAADEFVTSTLLVPSAFITQMSV